MTASDEDKRAAVTLSTNLSGQLVQAAVTMLTVEGAYIAYALVSRDTQQLFGLVAFSSAFAFVVSVYLSGRGITEARNKGFEGEWNLQAGKKYFNCQALALMLGLVLLAAMLGLSGNPKESELQKKVDELTLSSARDRQASLAEQMKVADQIRDLSSKLEAMAKSDRQQSAVTPRRKPVSQRKYHRSRTNAR